MDNFDAMAKEFDTGRRIKRAKIIAEKIRTHIKDGHNKDAIEYGSGTGLVGFQLANDFRSLLLIDSSTEMICQIEQKLSQLGNPSVSALRCDFMEAVPQGLQADYVFSSLVLHHIQDTEDIMTRFYSILRDGGHLIIVDIDQEDGSFHAKYPDFDGHNGFEQAFLVDLAEKIGFVKTEIQTFYRDSKIAQGKEAPYSLFIFDAMRRVR